MKVRLKFRVQKKGEYLSGKYVDGKNTLVRVGSVEMTPVTGGSPENEQFYEYTPSGRIEFGSINEAAIDALPLGGECYVTIEPIGSPATE